MISEDGKPWQLDGAHSAICAQRPDRFIRPTRISAALPADPRGLPSRDCKEIVSEEEFWGRVVVSYFGSAAQEVQANWLVDS